ncbi:MAG: hypothetical protein H7A21_09560 [Spirochaetales bacterium]|nr:hypothetical protein [Spirochaetales bacterium]
MAYHLLAEFSEEPNWGYLHARSTVKLPSIEFFPLSNPPALGISIPRHRTEEIRSLDLKEFLLELAARGASIYDLYTGEAVTRDDIDRVIHQIFN